MKILIADDDAYTRENLKNFLTKTGFQVSEARNSDDVISITQAFKPDGLVLNTDLKPIDGFTLCKKILKSNPNIKVVFVTKQEDELTKAKAVEVGAINLFSKPFQVNIITQLFLNIGLEYSAWEKEMSFIFDVEDVDIEDKKTYPENMTKNISSEIDSQDLSKMSFDLSATPKKKDIETPKHKTEEPSNSVYEEKTIINTTQSHTETHLTVNEAKKNNDDEKTMPFVSPVVDNKTEYDEDDEFEETDIIIVDTKSTNQINSHVPTPSTHEAEPISLEKKSTYEPTPEPIDKTSNEQISHSINEQIHDKPFDEKIIESIPQKQEPSTLENDELENNEPITFNLSNNSHQKTLNTIPQNNPLTEIEKTKKEQEPSQKLVFDLSEPKKHHEVQDSIQERKNENHILEDTPNVSINLNQKDKLSFSLDKENPEPIRAISEPNRMQARHKSNDLETMPDQHSVNEPKEFSIKPPRKNLIVKTPENVEDIIINPTEEVPPQTKKGFFKNLFKRS